MSWFRVSIPIPGRGPHGYLAAVQAFLFDVELAILHAGNPKDFGLFASSPADGFQYYYLPPTARRYAPDLFERYPAEEVEKPDPLNIREVTDHLTISTFGYWFPEFDPRPPNLRFRDYRHVPVSDPADDIDELQEHRLVWQRCHAGLARRFYVPGFAGYLPFFLSGAEEMIEFDTNGTDSLNEKQLLKGILYGLYEMSHTDLPWHNAEDRETYLYLLDLLGPGFGFNDPEKLILDAAASCRDMNGSLVSRRILLTGLDLSPFSSRIRSDLICDTWIVAAEIDDVDLLRPIPEWVMETTLSPLLKQARENICYYGLCAMIMVGFDSGEVEAYLRDFVYPNVHNHTLKVKIRSLLLNPKSYTIEDLQINR